MFLHNEVVYVTKGFYKGHKAAILNSHLFGLFYLVVTNSEYSPSRVIAYIPYWHLKRLEKK
jgi:hypothetical protein